MSGASDRALPAADVLICDLGGVLRRFDSVVHRDMERRHGLIAGTIEQTAFSAPELPEALRGRVPDEAWRGAVRERLVAAHGEPAGIALDEWSSYPGMIDPSVLDLLQQVRRCAPVVLLTNATSSLTADPAALPGLSGAVDAVVSSAQVGAAKPEAPAFMAAARAGLNHAAEAPDQPRFAFVDDSPGHVVAAEALGWAAHLYAGPDRMKAWLQDLRLLPPASGAFHHDAKICCEGL